MIRRIPRTPLLFLSIGIALLATSSTHMGPAYAQGGSALRDAARNLESPRQTARTFLNAMAAVNAGDPNRMDDALACLYLQDLAEEEREAAGRDLAVKLYEVLNSFTFKLDAIPEDPTSAEHTILLGSGEHEVRVVLARNKDAMWRFSYSKTLSNLDAYYARVQETSDPSSEDALIEPTLRSPRATMELFLTAMNRFDAGGAEDAVKTLDLSGVATAVRAEIGLERAKELKSVLDRYKRIDLVELPNARKGAPVSILRDDAGSIVMERVTVAGSDLEAWKFTKATVAALPALYDVYKDRPLVEGIESTVDVGLAKRLRDRLGGRFPLLMEKAFVLENYQWGGLLLIILLGMALSRMVTFLISRIIRKIFRRERLNLDETVERDFVRPIRIALMSWVWWTGLNYVELPPDLLGYILGAVKVITAFAAVWTLYRLIDIFGNYLRERAARTHNKFDDLLVPLVTRGLKVFTIIIGFVAVADIFDWELRELLAALGIGGLAVALASKDTLSNFFGSLTILMDRPFQIGDWVAVGDIDGNIESVGMRSTRVRTFYNSQIVVPNYKLVDSTIDNMGKRQYRRIKTTLGIAYDTPPESIEAFTEGIRELIRRHPYTRKDYYHVYLNGFGSSSLEVMLYCFVECPDWGTELREKHRLYLDIIRLAENLSVEFAFPTQTLFMRKDEAFDTPSSVPAPKTGEAIGRREAQRIITETLGSNREKPPPVTIQLPGDEGMSNGESEEERNLQQGEDDA